MKHFWWACRAALASGHRALVQYSATDDPEFQKAMAQTNRVPGWFTEVNAAAFWAVIQERRPITVVEIGSYLGRSTVLMGLAMKRYSPPSARLVAIDPHTGDRQQLEALSIRRMPTAELFALHISGSGLSDVVDAKTMTSEEAARGWRGDIDLLFVDGWHSYEAVTNDIVNWASRLGPRGLVCFDDYGNYEEVRRAVDDGCADIGLNLYGQVLAQAWAGRSTDAPRALRRAILWSRLRPIRPALP